MSKHRKLPIIPIQKARHIDRTGRINIPRHMRISTGMKDESLVTIRRRGKVIEIRPSEPVCAHCEGTGEHIEGSASPEAKVAEKVYQWLNSEADKLASIPDKGKSVLDIDRQRAYTEKIYRQIAQAVKNAKW